MAFFKFRLPGQTAGDASSNFSNSPAESVEVLRRRARHRLIGATVLVIIGVVGFPLVFDTQPRPVSVDIAVDDGLLRASGRVTRFAGFLKAYVEGSDDPEQALADRDLVLRRTICERDAANSLASTRNFPEGYEEVLVRALWGAERTLPRPLER